MENQVPDDGVEDEDVRREREARTGDGFARCRFRLRFDREGIPVYGLVDEAKSRRSRGTSPPNWYLLVIQLFLVMLGYKFLNTIAVLRGNAAQPSSPRIALAPGVWLNRVTRFLLTRDAHRRYVEPVILDMQTEYCDALAAGHVWHARWIAIRGHLLVLPGWLYGLVARAVRRMFSA